MKKMTNILAALLAAVFLLSSCAEGTQTAPTATTLSAATTVASTSTSASTTKKPVVTTKPPYTYIDENMNFRGEKFTFALLTDYDSVSGYGICESEGEIEAINKAIKDRNDYMYDAFNAKIEIVKTSSAALSSELASGNCDIDFVYAPYAAVNTEYCRDLSDMEVRFSEPFWNKTTSMYVDGHGYAISGAFSLEMYVSAECIFFNKTVKESIPSIKNVDFYDLVYSGAWTLDKLLEFSRAAKNEAGKFGFVSESDGIFSLYFGAGQSFISKKENNSGESIFENGFTESAEEVTDKIIEIFSDSSVKVAAAEEVFERFKNGETLFAKSSIGNLKTCSDEKIYSGLLTFPYINKNDRGKNCFKQDTPFLFVIDNGTSPEYTETFLFYFAYITYFGAYQDFLKLHKYQYTSDIDSINMIDSILISEICDFASMHNWLDINEKYISSVLAGENPIEGFRTELGAELEAKARAEYGQSIE